jgi:hypothetical protein
MNDFRKDVLKCKEMCLEELEKREHDIEGESTTEQLKTVILSELDKLLIALDKNDFPPKEERFLNSFANAFAVWGWNMQNPTELFLMLNKLNDEYKEL